MKIYKEVLQTKLKRARLSQAKLAKLAGITPNTISGWNKGNDARRTVIEKVASVLKCTVEELTSPPAADKSKSVDSDVDLIAHQYGVSVNQIITLAPVLFDVVAQKAVRNQRKRVENWYAQEKAALSIMPFDLLPEWIATQEYSKSVIEDTYYHALKGVADFKLSTLVSANRNSFFEALHQIDEESDSFVWDTDIETFEAVDYCHIQIGQANDAMYEIIGTDHANEVLISIAGDAILDGFSLQDVPQSLWRAGKGFERAKFIASKGGKKKLTKEELEFVPPWSLQNSNEVNPNGGDNA